MTFKPDGDLVQKPVSPDAANQAKAAEGIININDEAEITAQETKNGLPVISEADYLRLYNTDIRAAGAESSVTFNFRGYVRTAEGVFYREVIANNGIARGDAEKGIHVGTDGIVDYDAMYENHRMQGPEDVGEYDIYLIIPPEIQKRLNVVCRYDSCYTVEEVVQEELGFGDDEATIREDIKRRQENSEGGWIVIRLGLDPKRDPLARKKVEFIHQMIVSHLEQGGSPSEIKSLAQDLDELLSDMDLEALRREAQRRGMQKLLEQK